MIIKLLTTAAIGAMLLGGCTKTTTTTMQPKAGETASKIKVYYSEPKDHKYEEMGIINIQTGQTIFHDRSTEGMIKKMQAEAEKLGADAIIVRSANEGTWGLKGGGNTGFERGNGQAIAIKFID